MVLKAQVNAQEFDKSDYKQIFDLELGLNPYYSLDPKKPYVLGIVYDKEDCFGSLQEEIDYYGILKHQTIADVGAASGYRTVALSVTLDSVNFFIQDISDFYLNKTELKKIIDYYNTLRENSQTNNFKIVIGIDRKTNLPNDSLDLIIMRNTFHELEFPNAIIKDLYKKLKNNGLVQVNDAYSINDSNYIVKGCKKKAYFEKEVIQLFNSHKFSLINNFFPLNERNHNILTFKKNDTLMNNTFRKNTEYENQFLRLKHLEIANNSEKCNDILKNILPNISIIQERKHTYSKYISEIANNFYNKELYEATLNLYKFNLAIFPDIGHVNADLAIFYKKSRKFNLAKIYFKRAYQLNYREEEFLDELNMLEIQLNEKIK